MWVVGDTSREGDLIGSLIDPDEGGDSSSSSKRSRRAEVDSDDESDGERGARSSSSVGGSGGSEVVPLLAVYELLEALGPGVDVR